MKEQHIMLRPQMPLPWLQPEEEKPRRRGEERGESEGKRRGENKGGKRRGENKGGRRRKIRGEEERGE